jgi:UDP-GlcNAc:undecaprenyl-phosphate GlcNAc-1-phosphate transferase
MMVIVVVFILILNFFLLYYFEFYSKLFNIYDNPDHVRKLHKKKIPLLGGSIFLINILFLIFVLSLNLTNIKFFIDDKYYSSFFLPILIIFFIGLYDDKFTLNPYSKFFLISSVLVFVTFIDNDLVIKKLYFQTFNLSISLGIFSSFFTILCILLFVNALNMFDGLNLQVGFYLTILFLYFIINKIFLQLSIFLLLPLISFLYLNYKNKTFLGDSGTHVMAFIISYIIIKQYNHDFFAISVEEIFVLMMLPGLDMFRLFIQRLSKFNNPFKPDRNHIHHYFLNKLEFKYSFLIIQILILIPIILIPFSQILAVIFGIFFYFYSLVRIIK